MLQRHMSNELRQSCMSEQEGYWSKRGKKFLKDSILIHMKEQLKHLNR